MEIDVEVASTVFRGAKAVVGVSLMQMMNWGRQFARTTCVSIVGFRYRNVINVIGHFALDMQMRKLS